MYLCNDVITVFNQSVDDDGFDTYAPTVIEGVSWFLDTSATAETTGLKAGGRVIIRIPEERVDARLSLKVGDTLAHGAFPSVTDNPKTAITTAEVITVLSVTDNRRAPRAPHLKVTGQ